MAWTGGSCATRDANSVVYVIDASAILAWCFLDEQPSNSGALLKRFRSAGLLAPLHWSLEVSNILLFAERKGRVSPEQVLEFLELVGELGVEIDTETADRAWIETRALALLEGLTIYDAAYLELAMRRTARLVSKDMDLLAAAKRRGLSVLDLSA